MFVASPAGPSTLVDALSAGLAPNRCLKLKARESSHSHRALASKATGKLTKHYNHANMADMIQCETHGEQEKAFVCTHLASKTSGHGFHSNESDDNDFLDAWCDDCELIRDAYDGWAAESEKLIEVVWLCSRCFEWSRIRNTKTDVTLDDLETLRWKCGSCEEWHAGPCLDFSYSAPFYWSEEDSDPQSGNILEKDYCVIDNHDFFVRGVIHLPIIGTAETFRWGVWGSLSSESFRRFWDTYDDPKRNELPPMFSWLSNRIAEYPDTLNLKMSAQIPDLDSRPVFELELTDHPLSQEYYHGISAERVKEIMLGRLQDFEVG
jgi:hypothetical protein